MQVWATKLSKLLLYVVVFGFFKPKTTKNYAEQKNKMVIFAFA